MSTNIDYREKNEYISVFFPIIGCALLCIALLIGAHFLFKFMPEDWEPLHMFFSVFFVIIFLASCFVYLLLNHFSSLEEETTDVFEQYVRLRAQKDKTDFMMSAFIGTGILGVFATTSIAEKTLIALAAINIIILLVGIHYRFMCEEIYRKELKVAEEQPCKQLLQNISEQIKTIDAQVKQISSKDK